MGNEKLKEAFLELIRRAATDLRPDVMDALRKAAVAEGKGTSPASVLEQKIENVRQAKEGSTPVCQDTGALVFYIDYGPDHRQKDIEEAATAATIAATEKYYLRPNAVDSVTGKNTKNNVGLDAPHFSFNQRDEKGLRVRLLLKGGGSENCGAQVKLPDGKLKAGRDLDGVRKCVIDAVYAAQGKGCPPGIIGVCMGGARDTGYACAKEQLLRQLDDVNPDPKLAELEARLVTELNELGVGPAGLGGKTTVLGVKIGALHRMPACYFVSVAYCCWAYRKATMTVSAAGEVTHG